MAEIYPTVSDREQATQKVPNPAGLPDSVAQETPVGVYERPVRPVRNFAGLFLLLLVLALVAYFLLQWLR